MSSMIILYCFIGFCLFQILYAIGFICLKAYLNKKQKEREQKIKTELVIVPNMVRAYQYLTGERR